MFFTHLSLFRRLPNEARNIPIDVYILTYSDSRTSTKESGLNFKIKMCKM